MEVIALKGYRGETITLNLIEVLEYPYAKNHEDGYDIICCLEITCGCYTVRCDRYLSSASALYRFQKELKECYDSLEGKAKYSFLSENDLRFEISMRTGGKAIIEGTFQERLDVENCLSFEIETDQSCFPLSIAGIDCLKAKLNPSCPNRVQ